MQITYTQPLNGNCPIQAEGITPCGLPWYFRARDSASLRIGTANRNDIFDRKNWRIDDACDGVPDFFTGDYPGWATHEQCEAFIRFALQRFENGKANT